MVKGQFDDILGRIPSVRLWRSLRRVKTGRKLNMTDFYVYINNVRCLRLSFFFGGMVGQFNDV